MLSQRYVFFRLAFKFSRRVHFALRCKMLKSPIARLSAILLELINHPSGETDCIYEANVKWNSARPKLISIHVNSKYEWRKRPPKLISACFLMLSCLACNSVPENWYICVNRGHTYLLTHVIAPLNVHLLCITIIFAPFRTCFHPSNNCCLC